MTYADAMRRYGIDRPDLRFACELVDCTEYFRASPFRVFSAAGKADDWHVGAVVMPGGASQPRKVLDAWQEWARSRGAKGLAYVLVQDDGSLGGPVAKNLSDDERTGLASHTGARARRLRVLRRRPATGGARAAGGGTARGRGAVRPDRPLPVGVLLGRRRAHVRAHRDSRRHRRLDGHPPPVHSPTADYAADFQDRPAEALSQAYDIVLNGSEIGGGSIRIHRSEMQQRVFDVIGLSAEEATSQFGFLLEAFAYGPPPHGGIALGLDRLCALMAGAESIRDVIAFPEDGIGQRPVDRRPEPDHRSSAPGDGNRRRAGVMRRLEPSRAVTRRLTKG
jgi:aspartyl-tRNA synthetase